MPKITIYGWQRRARKNGLPNTFFGTRVITLKMAKRLEQTSTENYQLKKFLAEKELELAIFRE